LQINSTPVENLSLVDAKKVIEKTKDKLQLFITKSRYEDRLPLNKAQDDGKSYPPLNSHALSPSHNILLIIKACKIFFYAIQT
jgi:hypothetical protein